MSVAPRSTLGAWGTVAAAFLAWTTNAAPPAAEAEPSAELRVRLELADSGTAEGILRSIDAESVGIEAAAGRRAVPLAEVRRLVRLDPPPSVEGRVRVALVDGTGVAGDDFTWSGDTASVSRSPGAIEVPIGRVRRVEFRTGDAAAAPAWLAAVPEAPSDDLAVVAKGDAHELVECAITGVSPEAVTVVLDGETIPVKRGRVVGLVWARPRVAATGARVAISGGGVAASSVELAGDVLTLDGGLRLPAGLLESIDFAAGRTVPLGDLKPERVDTEPFIGALTRVEGVAAFFAPRSGPPAAGTTAPTLVVRPRTRATWPVPPGARRFRAVAVRADGARTQATVRVAVRADDRPPREAVLDATATAAPLDVDVAAANRLEVLVDFAGGDAGCAVRFEQPVFER
ncbi:MAG: hypothetical protein ACKO40_16510 [Planctomycetaceae bacterium]